MKQELESAWEGIPGPYSSPHSELGGEGSARHSRTEQILKPIWKEVLGLEQIDLDDDFFDLGGQSLMGVALVNEVGRAFRRRFPVQALLEAPTVRTFAVLIDEGISSPNGRRNSINSETVLRQVRQFISGTFLSGNANGLSDHESLLEQKIVDEGNLLHLVSFLEETYGFTIEDEDLTAQNLGSVSKISAYVLSRSSREKDRHTHP